MDMRGLWASKQLPVQKYPSTVITDTITSRHRSTEEQTHILNGPFAHHMKGVGELIKPLSSESSSIPPNSSTHITSSCSGLLSSSLGRLEDNVGLSTFETPGRIDPSPTADHRYPLNPSMGRLYGVGRSFDISASRVSPASDSIEGTAVKNKVDNEIAHNNISGDEVPTEDHSRDSQTNDSLPRRSLDASVSPDHKGMHTLVLQAMETVQRYESENEEQRRELNRLNMLLSDLQTERQQLVDRVALIKTTVLNKVTASFQALKAQEKDLHSLKSNSKELFSTVEECRHLLQEINQFKGAVSDSIEAVRIYLNPEQCSQEVTLPPRLSTRESLVALKNEITNKQGVLDMLRDRLSDSLSDVSSLRTFAFQTQEAYFAECSASRAAKEELNQRETRISELVAELNYQRAETLKALTQAAELETKIETCQQQ
ncbi:hypothetical protein Clacol_001827 [Clathrus columnatus]|uniref:Uncharacterized protein n=1 Tax=Clathrus columnatus TaxID=1419009 RepID=A0AAV5A2A2_9AGAM|nr:hypothetical protein Clacol_001827 [Clathrus columnatus]